jgi:hypothetical protein
MSKVKAKFRVTKIEMYESPQGSGNVTLTAGNDKEGDNTDWSQWTPNGSIQMTVNNPEAFKVFVDALQSKTRFYVNFETLDVVTR